MSEDEQVALPGDEFQRLVACLVAAMREVGRIPGSAHNRHEDIWWEEEFRAVERRLIGMGLLLTLEETEARLREACEEAMTEAQLVRLLDREALRNRMRERMVSWRRRNGGRNRAG
jgi:hypothetical protein